jgi:hypothetical protein
VLEIPGRKALMKPRESAFECPAVCARCHAASETAYPEWQDGSKEPTGDFCDYFFHPDRFFSRLFSKKPGFGVPLLVVLLSFIPPVIFWRVQAAYFDRYVPYRDLLGSGSELGILMILAVLWLLASVFFQYVTDFPESLTIEYECRRMVRKRGARIVPVICYAIIPLIICQFIGVAALGVILPSVVIVPPSTGAFEKYKEAEAAHRSHDSWHEPDMRVRMDFSREMMLSMYPANAEAVEGTEQVRSQLKQDPAIRMYGQAMAVLFALALLWTAILLACGLRHALNISPGFSALQTVLFLGCFTWLAIILTGRFILVPFP